MEKIRRSFKDYIFLVVVVILLAIGVFIGNRFLGLFAIVLAGAALVNQYNIEKKREEEVKEAYIGAAKDMEALAAIAVYDMPVPVFVLNSKKNIIWYNHHLPDILDDEDLEPLNMNIVDLFKLEEVEDENGKKCYMSELKGNYYKFYTVKVKQNDVDRTIVYVLDNSSFMNLIALYDDKKLSMMEIVIDNYDEARAYFDNKNGVLVFTEVDEKIRDFAARNNAYIKRYETDKFIIIMDKKDLENVVEKKFSILDEVREATEDYGFEVTLSIGASYMGDNPVEIHDKVRSCLDVALGRGGDQAVFDDGELRYFGGKNKAVEKRNKVKARVMSEALKQLIHQASNVLIMGHQNPDMDSFGSCMGILEACRINKADAHIVLNKVVPQISSIFEALKNEKPEYMDHFIDSSEAKDLCGPDSLLIVCDTQRKSSTECPELFDMTNNIVVIDHHRRGEDYIKNASLAFLEPYSSSASELVTELLSYMDQKIVIPQISAEALLAGITLDTKNFFYQTGVRTFEAASLLKRQGADSIKVKRFFKDDEKIIRYKTDVIANANYYKNIAIGVFEKDVDESIVVSAQSADDLLNIRGVDASFVLAQNGEKIHISGRSLGKISVQLILEKIGGGGNLTSAGAELDTDIDQAIAVLKNAIDEYLEEEEEDESDID